MCQTIDLSTSPNMVIDVKIIIMTLIINFRVVLRIRENKKLKSESPLSSSCQLIIYVTILRAKMHDIETKSPEPISTEPKSITVGNGRLLATALA